MLCVVLLEPTSHEVSPLLELATELGDKRVSDRFAAVIRLKMLLGHVSRMFGSVDEHVIPGLLFRGTRSRH
tara:strand:+ start:412 stop:624 length:213 start_codon:yes stop_codon:yes gene_type:complete